ncbi:MAG: DNA topoisomerase I [Nanoarchaeota archaeon]|nr:DNA topoisomerase I [Nanoarchaeota archaeon]
MPTKKTPKRSRTVQATDVVPSEPVSNEPFTLILTEKPAVAKKVADALAEDEIRPIERFGITSYCFTRGGRQLLVAPAVGHLFVLAEEIKKQVWSYPVFATKWQPVFADRKNTWAKKYYQNLQSVSDGATDFISACDYDSEGSTIAYNIFRYIFNTKKGRRMKFSTLAKDDLIEAYEYASPELDFPQINAGLARHHLDFLWGINVSRALTLALREAGAFKVLSSGRVQGPTLALLQQRQDEINKFTPTPYWQLDSVIDVNGKEVLATHETDKFWKKQEGTTAHENAQGKPAVVEDIVSKETKTAPPFPFDLTTLQRDVYQHFGYSPKQTLDLAQGLYEQAAISYPRTASQKLPAKIGFKSILSNLKKQGLYRDFCDQLLTKPTLKPNEGPKADPAHPAIYPTGNKPARASTQQKNVYDLIVRRFLATFGDHATRSVMNVSFLIGPERFHARGAYTVEPGWITFYKPYARFKEVILPPLEKREEHPVKDLSLLDKETQPPNRFTQATILKEMEKLGLGTKGTRASILQTLYDREYINEKSIVVSVLGSAVVHALEKHCPEILSADLTKTFEEDMEIIQDGKKEWETIVDEATTTLTTILKKFKQHDKEIGEDLAIAFREMLKRDTTIGTCTCGKNLIIRTSHAGKRFVGCTGYPDCTETFSLPQKGLLKMSKETCKTCGLFIVTIRQFRRRPWMLCVRDGFVNAKGEKQELKKKTPKKTKKKA